MDPGTRVVDAREHGLAGDGVTNDQPALAALVDALGAAVRADGRPRVISCPPGTYPVRDAATVWRSGVSLVGAGMGATRFVLSNAGARDRPVPLAYFTQQQHGAGCENAIADCTFAAFEIDGSDVETPEYDFLAKGLGLQYVLRGRFRDLWIHDTAATGFGCDFLQDTVVQGVLVERCGRMDRGDQPGGAGIGIGIGGWTLDERLTVTGCTATANGTNGIFVELQRETWPPPRGIVVTGCHAERNRFGISDWGAEGLLVTGCTMVANIECGFDISAQGTSHVGGRGGLLTDCLIDSNVGDGVRIGNTPGPYTVRGNRITANGGHGYRECDLGRGYRGAAGAIVIESNEVSGNAADGIRVEAELVDGFVVGNRVRGNGRACAPAASGGGPTVSYSAQRLTDTAADWPVDGHHGKTVAADGRAAVVTGNSATDLHLAPFRPGARTAWEGEPPPPGTPYQLPAAPPVRAGITVAAPTRATTLRGNRVWDGQGDGRQTHGLHLAPGGTLTDTRTTDNDLAGNGVAETAGSFGQPAEPQAGAG
jgi:hypothetical protein